MLRCRRRASSSSHGRSVSSVGKGNEGGVIVPKQLPNGKASRQSSGKLRVASYMFGDCSFVDCVFLSHARVTKSTWKHKIHRTLGQNFRSLEGRKRKNKKVREYRGEARGASRQCSNSIPFPLCCYAAAAVIIIIVIINRGRFSNSGRLSGCGYCFLLRHD